MLNYNYSDNVTMHSLSTETFICLLKFLLLHLVINHWNGTVYMCNDACENNVGKFSNQSNYIAIRCNYQRM